METLTVPQACARFNVSRHTLRRLHERGLIRLRKEYGERAALVAVAELERALAVPRPTGRPKHTPPAP